MILGIIGGGQLGRMMIFDAKRLGLDVAVLDPQIDAPASGLADVFIQASLDDADALTRLVDTADISTYEIEHINVSALEELKRKGNLILPDPLVLRNVNDKLRQKKLFAEAGIPVPRFEAERSDEQSAGSEEAAVRPSGKPVTRTNGAAVNGEQPAVARVRASWGYPSVQKARFGGYDGRGVAVIRSEEDEGIRGPSYYEELIDIRRELAVLVVRGGGGEIACYTPFEMRFLEEANICDTVIAPIKIEEKTEREARDIAVAAAESLNTIGVLAVELFETSDGRILLNEVAPRPHNSGHLTIEAAYTSQFEQHIRAICGLPLGSTELKQPAVMKNLLGSPRKPGVSSRSDHSTMGERFFSPMLRGKVRVSGMPAALSVPGVFLHLYGKNEARPYRKMGHLTALAKTIDAALQKAENAAGHIVIE